MKLRKTSIVFIFAMLLFTLGNFPASAQEQLMKNTPLKILSCCKIFCLPDLSARISKKKIMTSMMMGFGMSLISAL